jgi:hypothetical protein
MVFLNMLYTCSLAWRLIYGFLKYIKESMAGRVQDSITIRVGSLWIDVPMGALVNNNTGSLRTTDTSPVVLTNEQEVNSKSDAGFIPVAFKASKRRARKAAAAAKEKATTSKFRTKNVREASSHPSAPHNFPKPSSVKTPRREARPSSRRTTLGEWPVLVEKASTKKTTPCASAFSPSTPKDEGPIALSSSPTMLGAKPYNLPLKINEASPTKAANLSSISKLQPSDKGKAPMVEYGASSSEEESRPIMTRLRADAPEFIPSVVHNSGDGQERHELRWQGVCLFLDNTKGGHVSPHAMISDPMLQR